MSEPAAHTKDSRQSHWWHWGSIKTFEKCVVAQVLLRNVTPCFESVPPVHEVHSKGESVHRHGIMGKLFLKSQA